MEFDRRRVELPIDGNLQASVQKLSEDGWQLDPQFEPVAIYHLVRSAEPESATGMAIYHLVRSAEPESATGMTVKLEIDESKIFVLRNGERI